MSLMSTFTTFTKVLTGLFWALYLTFVHMGYIMSVALFQAYFTRRLLRRVHNAYVDNLYALITRVNAWLIHKKMLYFLSTPSRMNTLAFVTVRTLSEPLLYMKMWALNAHIWTLDELHPIQARAVARYFPVHKAFTWDVVDVAMLKFAREQYRPSYNVLA